MLNPLNHNMYCVLHYPNPSLKHCSFVMLEINVNISVNINISSLHSPNAIPWYLFPSIAADRKLKHEKRRKQVSHEKS